MCYYSVGNKPPHIQLSRSLTNIQSTHPQSHNQDQLPIRGSLNNQQKYLHNTISNNKLHQQIKQAPEQPQQTLTLNHQQRNKAHQEPRTSSNTIVHCSRPVSTVAQIVSVLGSNPISLKIFQARFFLEYHLSPLNKNSNPSASYSAPPVNMSLSHTPPIPIKKIKKYARHRSDPLKIRSHRPPLFSQRIPQQPCIPKVPIHWRATGLP